MCLLSCRTCMASWLTHLSLAVAGALAEAPGSLIMATSSACGLLLGSTLRCVAVCCAAV